MTNLIITSMIGNACKVVIGVALTLFSPQPQPIYNEYNQYASNYDQLNSGKIANDFGIESLRERMGQYVNGKVLDAAVGTGLQNTYYDWNRISSYNGIDLSIEMLNIAQNKYEIEHGNQGSNANGIPASFTLMDAQALEYSDQTVSANLLQLTYTSINVISLSSNIVCIFIVQYCSRHLFVVCDRRPSKGCIRNGSRIKRQWEVLIYVYNMSINKYCTKILFILLL